MTLEAVGGTPGYRRPVWLVGTLTFLTLGLVYPVVWVGLTWHEMHRHRGYRAHPWWHAFSQLVPLYRLVRRREHFGAIQDLLSGREAARVHPNWVVAAWAVSNATPRITERLGAPLPVDA